MESSVGLGPRINPGPSLARAGQVPAVNAAGDAYELKEPTTDTGSVSHYELMEESANIDFTEINSAVDTGITVPANTRLILINLGAASDNGMASKDLIWVALPITEWDRMDGVDVGDVRTQNNVRVAQTHYSNDVASVTTLPLEDRIIYLMRGNNGNVFVSADDLQADIYPLTVIFEIHTTLTLGINSTIDPTPFNAESITGLQFGVASDDVQLIGEAGGVLQKFTMAGVNSLEEGSRVDPFDGRGAPSVAPTEAQRLSINEAGHVYPSKASDVSTTTDSTWSTAPDSVEWARFKGVRRYVASSIITVNNDFMYGATPRLWLVRVDAFNTMEFHSWNALKAWYNAVPARNTGAPVGLFNSTFLVGPNVSFADDAAAALFIQSHNFTDTTGPFMYLVGGATDYAEWNMHLSGTAMYTAGVTTHTEVDSFSPRLAQVDDLPEIMVVANEAAATTDGDRAGVLYLWP